MRKGGNLVRHDVWNFGFLFCIVLEVCVRKATANAPLKVQSFNFPLNVTEGQEVQVICGVTGGEGILEFQWTKDGGPPLESTEQRNVHTMPRFSVLAIRSVSADDSGNYTCTVTSAAGKDVHTASLIVKGPPRWTVEPEDLAVAVGAEATFLCAAHGHPPPVITWKKRKNDEQWQPVREGGRWQVDEGTLRIAKVQQRDSSMYMCEASNGVQDLIKKAVTLSVKDTPKIQSFSFPEDLSAGQSAKAICTTVSGSGPLSFKWFKDGVLIDYVSHTRVRNQDDLSILTISPLVAGSSGHYTCEVSNSYGSDSFTADLVVRVPPYWVSEPKDSSVNRGGTVTINCTASGYPQPVITWRRLIGPNQDGNGMLTINTNGRHVVHPNGALTIRQVTLDDVGDYLCIASNNQGTDLSKVVQFRVHVPASFEEKSSSQTVLRGDSARLTCEALGDRPVTITWTKDRSPLSNKDEDAARYSIFERISENGTLSEIHLEQVERHDSAHYACTAQNAYGKDERTIKLVVLEVPSAPLEVRLDHAWSRSVSLSWSKPFNGNSPITKFIIQYWRDAGAPHRLEEKVVPASQTSVVITDLQPGTSYAVRVLAENEVGRGTPSSIQQLVTQEEEPEAPPTDLWVEAKGAGALKIRWKAPPKDHWNGRLKGYYLSYKVHGSDPFAFKTVPFQDSGLEQELILTGLQKSTKYTVNVKAYNSAGSGPVSQEVTVTTSEDDPPPPPSIWVAEQTTTSITLKWDQRDEPNVQITHYTLYYKEDQSGWLEIAFPVTSEFYTLTGLKEGTWYQLRMRATSKQGQSDNSEVLTVRTDGEAPVDKPSQHLQTNEEPQIPPYLRISVVAPVAIAVVIIALVLIGACVYVKLEQKRCPNMEEGVPTKQFQYTSTATLPRMAAQRYVDVDKTRPLLPTPGFPPHPPSEGYPSPYATMPLRGATFDRRRFNHEEFRGGGAMISDHNCHHGSMRKKPRAFQECAEIHHYDEPA